MLRILRCANVQARYKTQKYKKWMHKQDININPDERTKDIRKKHTQDIKQTPDERKETQDVRDKPR